MTRRDIDGSDIQAIAKTAFAALPAASYILLRVEDAHAARQWLRGLTPASIKPAHVLKQQKVGRSDAGDHTYQVAFTAKGLCKLGIGRSTIAGFSPEFLEGMAGDENRSRRLGDIGENAPSNWNWGVGEREPDILLIVLAKDTATVETSA